MSVFVTLEIAVGATLFFGSVAIDLLLKVVDGYTDPSSPRWPPGAFSASTFVDFRQVGFSKALGLSSDAFQTRSVHSNAPRDRLDEPAGLFLGAVASPQSRPPLHPAQSTYKCPNPAEVSLRSDTTFLLLPSHHRWFQDDRWYDLIVILDDATSEIYYAQLVEDEATRSVMAAIREVVEKKGWFASIYSDRAGHFFQTPKAGGLVDTRQLTQVGRAMKQLGIRMIPAY